MSQISNYLEDVLVNLTLRNTAYTPPATIYMALYTSDPTDADVGTEVSAPSYSRTAVTFAASSNGVTTNTNLVLFPAATTDWGTVTHIGLRDALTGGNLLYYAPLQYQKIILNGDLFDVNIGNLSVQLS